MSLASLLIICISLLFFLLLIRKKKYNVSLLKCVIITLCSGSLGFLGTYLLYFIENGNFVGQSFYGAVLFFPIFLFPVAKALKMQLTDLLDFATPPGLAMLGVFKFNCYLGGCCGGKVMSYSPEGIPSFFPSQIVEMICAIAITAILLILERMDFAKKRIYSICLVVYGITRFILNFYRWETAPFVLGLTAGHFWSIVSVIIGIISFFLIQPKSECSKN